MLERLLFLGYLFFVVAQGTLRGMHSVSHSSMLQPSMLQPSALQPSMLQPSMLQPSTTVIPKPNPIRQEATIQYFRRIDELDNNIVYRPLASEFTTEMH